MLAYVCALAVCLQPAPGPQLWRQRHERGVPDAEERTRKIWWRSRRLFSSSFTASWRSWISASVSAT